MALADTARLIASLELQDKFTRPAANAERALGGLERKTGSITRIGSEVSRGVGAAATNIARLSILAGGVVAANVTAGVRSLAQLESVETQTKAVLASTRGAAGLTAQEIRDLAEEYENLNATIDDKVIQSGENLLLTFTSIDKKAFRPALEAALDMNQAMGGGEEGLQQTIIRVGKALQDPIRGATALRRVGVNLTEQQQKQIKTLVEQNDLYGAQQLILKELTTEFGGSFAKAGDTATAKYAKFQDAVEGAQQALATALLPALGKVADKVSTFLSDPKVLKNIEDFGKGLADGFDDVVEFAGKIPWGTIGTSLQIAGQGAKAVLSAFTSLPGWVQTAVITGWGLNKLTGGALGNIAGELGKGLLGGFTMRGGTPANPLFVSQVGPGGVGGTGGGAAGGLGTAGGLLLTAGAAATVTGGILNLQDIEAGLKSGTKEGVEDAVKTGLLSGNFGSMIARAISGPIEEALGLNKQNDKVFRPGPFKGGNSEINTRGGLPTGDLLLSNKEANRILRRISIVEAEQKDELRAGHTAAARDSQRHLDTLYRLIGAEDRHDATRRSEAERNRAATDRVASRTSEMTNRLEAKFNATNSQLGTIARKDFSPKVNVNTVVNANVSIDNVVRSAISQRVATNGGTFSDVGPGI